MSRRRTIQLIACSHRLGKVNLYQYIPTTFAASDLKFPEGPVALADGSVAFVEIAGGTLKRVGSDGTLSTVANTGGGLNGMAVGPDGAYYACNNCGSEYKQGQCFKYTNVDIAKDYVM